MNVSMATSMLKELVSKQKKRYKQDGFDLDLTYIDEKIIAMGFPGDLLEGVYRNHIDDVVRFLESKHKDHYKIYNLCSERTYDAAKFQHRVAQYPFPDHSPPPLDIMRPFCKDVSEWLISHTDNIAVVHCKAGKGRTGVMICAYLLHTRLKRTSKEALEFYDQKRTHDKKGVTIPSQRRYVEYYAEIVQNNFTYQPVKLTLRYVEIEPIPIINGSPCNLYFVVSTAEKKLRQSQNYDMKRCGSQSSLCMKLPLPVIVCGDVHLDFYHRQHLLQKEKLFHFWFNTYFVREERMRRISSGTKECSECGRRQHHSGSSQSSQEENTAPSTKNTQLPFTSLNTIEIGACQCVGSGGGGGTGKSAAGAITYTVNERPAHNGSAEPAAQSRIVLHQNQRTFSNPESLKSVQSMDVLPETKYLVLTLTKSELDKAVKDKTDKIFAADFKVRLYFTPLSDNASPSQRTCGQSSNGKFLTDQSQFLVGDDAPDDDTDTDTDEDEEWQGCESSNQGITSQISNATNKACCSHSHNTTLNTIPALSLNTAGAALVDCSSINSGESGVCGSSAASIGDCESSK